MLRKIVGKLCSLFRLLPWKVIVIFNQAMLVIYLLWQVMDFNDIWVFLVLKGWIEFGAFLTLVFMTSWIGVLIMFSILYFKVSFASVDCRVMGIVKAVVNVIVLLFLLSFVNYRIYRFGKCMQQVIKGEYEYKGRVGEKTLYFMNCFMFEDVYKVGSNWDCVKY